MNRRTLIGAALTLSAVAAAAPARADDALSGAPAPDTLSREAAALNARLFPGFALADYVRTYSEPAAIHGVCEDYRAAAGIDSRLLEAARKAGRKIGQPLLAIWGAKGTVGKTFDVVGLWQQEAATVTGHALPCGHLIPEEDPDGLVASLGAFLQAG